MMRTFDSFKDEMAKLAAKRAPSGGTQYLPEVALGPHASAKNQAFMRLEKVQPSKTLSLKELQRKCSV